MKNNIILIGFMGCGKTTVGKQLAQNLGYTFIDSDVEIETLEGTSINEIFDKKGEDYFRKLEAEVIEKICQNHYQIIATGGGAVLNKKTAQTLKNNGFVCYLSVSPQTVISRLKNDNTRPLLNQTNRDTVIDSLLREREPMYLSACNMSFDANGNSTDIVNNILSTLCDKS